MTRLNTKLTQHIDIIAKQNDDLRKTVKQHAEKERREKDAAESAIREQQEIEDAKNSHLPGYVPKAPKGRVSTLRANQQNDT